VLFRSRGLSIEHRTSDDRQAGLRNYQWSSYSGYAGVSQPKPFVRQDLILRSFGGGKADQKTKMQYRQFVEEGLRLNISNPFRQVRRQIALGDESFTQRVTERLTASYPREGKSTIQARAPGASNPAHLIERVARHYRVPRKTITNSAVPDFEAQNVAIWLLRQKSGLTLREIGQMFGGIDCAAISQRVRRLNQQIRNRKGLRRTCNTLTLEKRRR